MSERPWYSSRKTLRWGSALYDTVRQIDSELKWRAENFGKEMCEPPTVYSAPRTDFGRVTWTTGKKNYRTLSPQYLASDHYWPERKVQEGFILPASNVVVPDFDPHAVPCHIAHMLDIASIEDIDDGFELFGGLEHETSVYFIEGRLSGLVKIGIASHIQNRFASIQTGSPEPLSLICDIPANRHFEKFLHALFEPLRHHGEWFYPHWSISSVVMGLSG